MSVESPITVAMDWHRSEARVFRFTVRDEDNQVQSIDGWSLRWQLQNSALGSIVYITKTTEAGEGVTITDGAGGKCEVAIEADDTEDLLPDVYYHTLWRTDASTEALLARGDANLLA